MCVELQPVVLWRRQFGTMSDLRDYLSAGLSILLGVADFWGRFQNDLWPLSL